MIISRKLARTLRNLDILVVDENSVQVSTLEKMLLNLGVNSVEGNRSGADALETLKVWPANLVFVDVNLMPTSGIEVIERIRRGEEGIDPRTPVIAMSAVTDPKTVTTALLAGANSFVVKPVASNTLLQRIERAVTTRVVYQLKGEQYVANHSARAARPADLVYDGLLPSAGVRSAKTVEKPRKKDQEGDMWVLD